MRRYILSSLTPLLCFFVLGCASTTHGSDDGTAPDTLRPVYVVRRGWHTGIAIAAADWPNQDWTVLSDFPAAEYLEFGWGEERYYQAERNTFWLGVRAALWPTSSVIHVIGLREPVAANAQADELVQLRIPGEHLREIAIAIEQEFAARHPQETGSTLRAAPAPNRFYKAGRSFYFPRMCNWWLAMRLRQADCPVEPWSVVSASRVMREARECADRVEPSGRKEAQ